MRYAALIILSLFIVSFSAPLQAQTQSGELIEKNIPAPSLKDNLFAIPAEQPVAIYLPPSYKSSTKSFPVVYFLPGFGDAVRYFTLYGLYQGFMLKESMNQLIEQKQIKEMIIVIPNGLNFMGGSFYVNSSVTGRWEDYIINDVVSYIDNNFRTIPHPASRGISGHSMGGFGALNIAMKHPDVFGSVYALSPGLFDSSGLAKHAMVSDTNNINQFLDLQQQLDSLTKEDSKLKFLSWMSQKFIAETDFNTCFAYAYGIAFSPNLNKNAPFTNYPFKKIGDRLVIDSTYWKQYDSGFGQLAEKVKTYRSNFMKLSNIGIDFGTSDEVSFVPDGCRYLSKLLSEAGIQNQLVPFDGHHQDKFRERFEKYLLPFFSGCLIF